jgi:TIR domain
MALPQAESAKTFISYARREDSAFALKLAKELRRAGANIWLDTLDIAPGQPWDPSVEQALSECPRLLVIVTPASLSSENVMGETLYALIAGKMVIPVLYQECKIASRMRRLQCVDFTGDYQRGLLELLKILGVRRASTPVIEQVPQSVQGVESRRLRVFLCHGSGDKPAIREMYVRLQQDGFEPWLDEEDLLPGQDWQVEIPKAVRAADVVLVCLSPHAVNKAGYVQKEIKFALDAADEKPEGAIFIIPVKLEECAVPERLSRWHWVDFSSVKGYEKVVRVLRLRATSLGLDTTPLIKTARPLKQTRGTVSYISGFRLANSSWGPRRAMTKRPMRRSPGTQSGSAGGSGLARHR